MPDSNPETQAAILVMTVKLERLTRDVEDLSRSHKDLVDAWTTATGVVRFVKLLATFVAAIGALYVFVTAGFRPKG